LGAALIPTIAFKARHEVLKTRPARRVFAFLGRLLLGDLPPLFD
jgi:hypothetical protein